MKDKIIWSDTKKEVHYFDKLGVDGKIILKRMSKIQRYWNPTSAHYTSSLIGRLPATDAFCGREKIHDCT
jgi:hypothetical protein